MLVVMAESLVLMIADLEQRVCLLVQVEYHCQSSPLNDYDGDSGL